MEILGVTPQNRSKTRGYKLLSLGSPPSLALLVSSLGQYQGISGGMSNPAQNPMPVVSQLHLCKVAHKLENASCLLSCLRALSIPNLRRTEHNVLEMQIWYCRHQQCASSALENPNSWGVQYKWHPNQAGKIYVGPTYLTICAVSMFSFLKGALI